jgi:hypothetical protein
MLGKLSVFYPHRRNKDGSFDSICLGCLETIARTATEAELTAHDITHKCNQAKVGDRRLLHSSRYITYIG